ERSQELKEYIEQRNQESDRQAPRIPMVPEKLILKEQMKQRPDLFRTAGIIPVGMGFNTVDYDMADMKQAGSMALLGDQECRIRFVRSFLTVLARNIVFHNVEAVIIDDRQKSLADMSSLGFVKNYTNDVSEGLMYVSDFYHYLAEREDAEEMQDLSAVILVLNNAELFKQICTDKNLGKEFAGALKRANGINAFLLVAQVENAPVGFNSSEVLKALRDERQGILFAPLSENKFYEVSGRVKADAMFDKSMGYHFNNGNYSRIKVFE
ncbi:MAG: hypothetical protein NC121_18025, partial [Blautia sp.]|nr:hypothetical protein [Blautia sp.]